MNLLAKKITKKGTEAEHIHVAYERKKFNLDWTTQDFYVENVMRNANF